MTKKGSHIIAAIAAGILLLVFAALIAVQVPQAQRKAAEIALAKLSETLGSTLQIGDVNIRPSGAIFLKDLLIIDPNPYMEGPESRGWAPADTIARLGRLSATISVKSLLSLNKECVQLNRVNIEDGYFHITIKKGETRPINNLETALGLVPKEADFEADPPGGPNLFDIRKVRIRNFRFRMNNYIKPESTYSGFGMNFDDLDATIDEAAVTNLRFAQGVLTADVPSIRLREKSGYAATVSANVEAGMGKVLVDNLRLKDEWSDLSLRFFNMTFKNGSCFRDFLNRIKLEARFRPSTVSSKTLSYILGGALADIPAVFDVKNGHILGFVSDLALENFTFSERRSRISGTLGAKAKGLPDINSLDLSASVKDFTFTTEGISALLGGKADISKIAKGQRFVLDAEAEGFLNDLDVTGTLACNSGVLNMNATLEDLMDKERPMHIRAGAGTGGLDVGALLGVDKIGLVDFNTKADVVLEPEDMQIVVDTINIRRANLLGYEYRNIHAAGRLAGDNLWARMEAKDSNLVLSLLGNVDLKPRNGISSYRLGADIKKADLVKLGFIDSYENFSTSMSLDANINMDTRKYINGKARVGNLVIGTKDGDFSLGNLDVDAESRDSLQSINIASDMLAATLSSDKPVTSMVSDILNASLRKDLSAICPPVENPEEPGEYRLGMKFSDTYELTDRLVPGLYIESGTELLAGLDRLGNLSATVTSGRIAKGRNFIKDMTLALDNAKGQLNVSLTGNQLSTQAIAINSPAILLCANDNNIDADVRFAGGISKEDYADINVMADLAREEDGSLSVLAKTLPSSLNAAGNLWEIDESEIALRNGGIKVKGFNLHNGDQYLKADGGLRTGEKDSLTVRMDRFNLAALNDFTARNFGVGGLISGDASIRMDKEEAPEMIVDLAIDSLALSGTQLGQITLDSRLDESSRKILFDLDNIYQDRHVIELDGYYLPSGKELDAKMVLNALKVDVAEAFLSGVLSEMSGTVDGTFHAFLKDGKPDIESKGARFNDILARVAMTGAPYHIDGPFEVGNDGIDFEQIAIRDDSYGTATLTGKLKYDRFKDMALDARLAFNRLKVVDTPETPNSNFYGHMRASGNASLTGPLNALAIDADVTTDGDGDIHVPLSGKLSSTRGKLLTYVEHKEEDNYSKMLERYYTKEKATSDMRVSARVVITEGMNAFMEIDKSVGNVISIAGNGRVNLDLRPSKDQFNLNGNYVFRRGKYHFVLPGILEKDLNIKDGSSVMFGGDLMESQINVTATYSLKTSLNSLITTESSKSGARANVDCGITISNKLSSPDLSFFIDVPDMEPTTKSLVEGALNTEDKVQKQFVALLLLGTFIPNESSGVFSGTNMLYSNLGEIVSSQMTNILQKLNIPVDVGLRYQENTVGNDIFDVALSTQLFNNRVSVSGNVGNKQYKSATGSTSTGDVAGDVDIEVKLDQNGIFRVKLFSHSSNSYTNFLDNYQRNGMGLSFQKDFAARKHKGEEEGAVIINIDE